MFPPLIIQHWHIPTILSLLKKEENEMGSNAVYAFVFQIQYCVVNNKLK
jgi:hypothetical protein